MGALAPVVAKALRWPVPALLTWVAAWALAMGLRSVQAPLWAALSLPVVLGALVTWLPGVADTAWRRVFVAAGFPLSLIALGQGAALPAWLWLAPLALLLLAYPVHAWRDAPVFPTPAAALDALPNHVDLAPSARVLDAGCGMGDGLVALHRALPDARLEGVEWSALWRWVSAWRCRPWASVRRGDMWADDWAAYDLVYLFQRPETMPRAMAKAQREMRPGTWLVSLEFEARDEQGRAWTPCGTWSLGAERTVWVYRMGPGLAAVKRA